MAHDATSSSLGFDQAHPAYAAARQCYEELLNSRAIKTVSRKTPVIDRLIRSAADAYARGDCHMAAEIFTIATETDNLNEMAFFGVGLASLELNRIDVARANFAQGRVLHQAVGSGRHLALYDDIIQELNASANADDSADEDAQPRGAPPNIPQRWYTSLAKRHPKRIALRDIDGFDTYFFDGLTPPAPILRRSDRLATIGSCFAENMSKALAKQDGNHIPIDDSFFTTFTLREAFEYAFGTGEFRSHWRDGAGYSIETVRTALAHGDAYIITLGLAEIWFNRRTGEVYPSGVAIETRDPNEHGFRVSTLEENFANIEAIYHAIRRNRRAVPVIWTLSPVPLAATFRDINCVAANTVSKAILRLAIDRLIEAYRDDENLFYFPSYELVRDYFVNPFMPDMRHVKSDVIEFVVAQFMRKFMIAES